MLEPGVYYLGLNGRVPSPEDSEFSVTVEANGLQSARCLHGGWSMTMWEEGGQIVGKIDGGPGTKFHNITGDKIRDPIPTHDCDEQICF